MQNENTVYLWVDHFPDYNSSQLFFILPYPHPQTKNVYSKLLGDVTTKYKELSCKNTESDFTFAWAGVISCHIDDTPELFVEVNEVFLDAKFTVELQKIKFTEMANIYNSNNNSAYLSKN